MVDKTDLTLHIGMPRTGTTTLQEHFFPNISGYLGRSRKMFGKPWGRNAYTNKLLQYYNYHAKTANFPRRAMQAWCDSLKNLAVHKDLKNIIISDESLQQGNDQFKGYIENTDKLQSVVPPKSFIFSFLENILYYNVWNRGNVKVIISFRNQCDWIPSVYARSSDRNPNASTKDFELKTKIILKNYQWRFSWMHWISKLEPIVGKKNLCILIMEDINGPSYWEAVCNFLDISYFKNYMTVSSNAENKSSISDDTKKILPLVINSKEKQRESYFKVSRDMKQFIMSYYNSSNRELANYIGRDLQCFGYY